MSSQYFIVQIARLVLRLPLKLHPGRKSHSLRTRPCQVMHGTMSHRACCKPHLPFPTIWVGPNLVSLPNFLDGYV